jgi:hypothetical protein
MLGCTTGAVGAGDVAGLGDAIGLAAAGVWRSAMGRGAHETSATARLANAQLINLTTLAVFGARGGAAPRRVRKRCGRRALTHPLGVGRFSRLFAAAATRLTDLLVLGRSPRPAS